MPIIINPMNATISWITKWTSRRYSTGAMMKTKLRCDDDDGGTNNRERETAKRESKSKQTTRMDQENIAQITRYGSLNRNKMLCTQTWGMKLVVGSCVRLPHMMRTKNVRAYTNNSIKNNNNSTTFTTQRNEQSEPTVVLNAVHIYGFSIRKQKHNKNKN